MIPKLIYHVKRLRDGWLGIPQSGDYPQVFSTSKNETVNKTVEVVKRISREAMIVIHSFDGRILEQRKINI